MNGEKESMERTGLTRREFVHTATAAGLMMGVPAWAQEQAAQSQPVETQPLIIQTSMDRKTTTLKTEDFDNFDTPLTNPNSLVAYHRWPG